MKLSNLLKTPFSPHHSQSSLSWYKCLPLTDPVTWRKLLNLVTPQFPHLWNSGNDNIYLTEEALQNSIQPQWTQQKSNCSCPLKVLGLEGTEGWKPWECICGNATALSTNTSHLPLCTSPWGSQAQETGGTRSDRFPLSLCSGHWCEGVNTSMVHD